MAGSNAAALSIVTMSPESMVSTGFRLERKYPMCTVCGLGVSVYSAARSAGLPIDAMNSSAYAMVRGVRKLQGLRRDRAANIGMSPTAHGRHLTIGISESACQP